MKRFLSIALIITIGAALAVGGWYFSKLNNDLLAAKSESRACQNSIDARVKTRLHVLDSISLHLISEPFTWAIRTELLEDNISTIHQYLSQFVKHDEIKLIAVLDADGKILSATDKKVEGRLFREAFGEELIDLNQFRILTKGEQRFIFHPIMGFDHRLGTLFIIYHLDLESQEAKTGHSYLPS